MCPNNETSSHNSKIVDNSGIINCTPIINVIQIISNNPFGCKIPN